MALVGGLMGPAVMNGAVRAMTDVDRDAIRRCDDSDALQELRARLLAAKRGRWTRPIGISSGLMLIVLGLLQLNRVSHVVITTMAMLMIAIGAFSIGYQARVRQRVKWSAEWIGTIDAHVYKLADANATRRRDRRRDPEAWT